MDYRHWNIGNALVLICLMARALAAELELRLGDEQVS